MKFMLLDGIGPFFRHCRQRHINWSKIPFSSIERDGVIDSNVWKRIVCDFTTLLRRAASMGFTGITLDDLAHLSIEDSYPDDLKRLINSYRCAYRELFDIAGKYNMGVYITTDVMYFPESAATERCSITDITSRLERAIHDVLLSFPRVSGIIFRLGECDGKDVHCQFRSRLMIKKPRHARSIIQSLLPLFEDTGRTMIVRTWTVGAYAIGDLIWNRNTFDRVFGGIDSPNLIISLKYGESDFFRYLPINKLFFHSSHKKIVELQARREYEGAGQYPSFIGWDCERISDQLSCAGNIAGAWIWVQSGGWTTFRRLTFIDKSAVWNELNAFVCARILLDGCSTEEAIKQYGCEHLENADTQKLLLFLRLSDEVIKELLYVDQLARQKMFFRRVRVPPLLSVFWDQIIINHSMCKLLRCLVPEPDEAILQGYMALRKLQVMKKLAADLGLPVSDIEFQYHTFHILAQAREYYFGAFDQKIVQSLQHSRKEYMRRYKQRYTIRLDFSPLDVSRRRISFFLGLWMRKRRGYRIIDRILMINLLSWFSPVFLLTRQKTNSRLLNNRAMGIETVMK